MRGPAAWGVVGACLTGLICLTGLVGCSSGGGGDDPQDPASGISLRPSTSAPATTPAASERGSATPADGCPSGAYQIEKFTGKVPLPGTGSPMSGEGEGLLMTFTDGTWKLTGDASESSEVDIDGVEAELTVDGTVEGTYEVRSGSTFEFTVGESEGKASLAGPGIDQEISMDQLALALTPNGTANVLCSDEDLTLDSETITLEMERD